MIRKNVLIWNRYVKSNYPLNPTFENGIHAKFANFSTKMDMLKKCISSFYNMDLMDLLSTSLCVADLAWSPFSTVDFFEKFAFNIDYKLESVSNSRFLIKAQLVAKIWSDLIYKNDFSQDQISRNGKIFSVEWPKLQKGLFKLVKFIYSEEATKFCKIFTLLLTVKSSQVKLRFHKILWPSRNIWTLNWDNSRISTQKMRTWERSCYEIPF